MFQCSVVDISQSVVRAKKQMVTEAERELLRSGKFDELVEKQRRIDAERDAEVHYAYTFTCISHIICYKVSYIMSTVMQLQYILYVLVLRSHCYFPPGINVYECGMYMCNDMCRWMGGYFVCVN